MPRVWRAWCPLGDQCRTSKNQGGSWVCKSTTSLEDLERKVDHHLEFSSYHLVTDPEDRKVFVAGMETTCVDEDWGPSTEPNAEPAAKKQRVDGGVRDLRANDVHPGLI